MGLAMSRQSGKKTANPALEYLLLSPDTNEAAVPSTTHPLPTVLCFHGSGHSSHQAAWLAVVQGIAPFAPILYYDRASTVSRGGTPSRNQTPEDAVKDLERLLRALHLPPPYILVAHSYGGTIARTFLQRHQDHVVGMVLAETGQETPTRYDEEQYRGRILGRKPLSVMHAVASVAGAPTSEVGRDDDDAEENGGGENGGGDLGERHAHHDQVSGAERRMRRLWVEEDERLKKAQLQMSLNARYVRVEGCGHHVVRERPDVVVEEVRWVLGSALSGSVTAGGMSGLEQQVKEAMRRIFRK